MAGTERNGDSMKKVQVITRVTYLANGVEYQKKEDAAAALGLHICPKCNGTGSVSIEYNAYPSGLPDSGWVEDIKTKIISCDLCAGGGYTEQKFEPVTKVVGYKSS